MVARSDSMFGCYDSYSYRLWSLANVWNTCQIPPLSNGVKEEELSSNSEYFIKCPQCQKGCQTFQALKEHMETSHSELTVSSDNGTTLSTPGAVSPTPSLVTGTGGPFGCAQCTTSFSSKDQLEKHELLHSPNAQVSCKICNKTFANVYRLQRHMISHDESAVLRKFKCTQCDKAFKFKHHLKEHIRIHSGEKPFECGNCGKRFSHSGSYSSHMTSKKCLVMNLKLGRTRAPPSNSHLDKNAPAARPPKRPNITPINNNITTSPNHNNYLPILPKYSEAAAAFLQSAQALASNSSITPFYLPPPSLLNPAHPISPYSIPTLGHLLEQLQQHTNNSPRQLMENEAVHEEDYNKTTLNLAASPHTDNHVEDIPKSNTSSCGGDLVMDEDTPECNEHFEKNNTESHQEGMNNNNDLEAVKRILETVNATVTKQLLQANMQKFSASESSSGESVNSPKESFSCGSCKKIFGNSMQLEEHDCVGENNDLMSEGLAAKLEEAISVKQEENLNGSISGNEDQDYDRLHDKNEEEMDCESITTTDHVSEDGRKVRVRSLISDEQLKVLKDNYGLNPRPKREDLEKIASTIGFPVRVVQVWFQNTRARDRREGRLIQVPYTATNVQQSNIPNNLRFNTQGLVPSSSLQLSHKIEMSPNQYYSEQPLDLSFKRETHSPESSPGSSPNPPNHQEHLDEVVNLSRKSSRSPNLYYATPNHQTYHQNSNSSEPCRSPSPPLNFNTSSRLAQILNKPPHKLTLPGMGLVPMDQIMQLGGDFPTLSQLISNRISSLSPNSEKRPWCETRDVPGSDLSQDEEQHKRNKVSQFVLKSLSSPVLGGMQEPEVEGQFSCDQCDKSFSKQSSLARHKYEHSGQRPHKCDECPKAFKHKHHLTEHKRLHSGEKPFQCSKCFKRFSHSGSYSQHMNHRYSYCKPYRE